MILVALPESFAGAMAEQAESAGYTCEIASGVGELAALQTRGRPAIVITNLDGEDGLELVAALRDRFRSAEIVAVTGARSIVHVAQAVRRGASTVMARPTTFGQVTAALGHDDVRPADHMSLDRAIWEFLNQSVLEAGSISGAARLLRLDRTSLKRMLRKVPPI